MNFNKLILGGHLTGDIETVKPSGNAHDDLIICKGSIAVNMPAGVDEKGKSKTEPMFIAFKAFGKRAENIAKFFKKGSGILLEGQLRVNRYEDKDGNKKKSIYMLVEKFDFVDKLNTENQSTDSRDLDDDMSY